MVCWVMLSQPPQGHLWLSDREGLKIRFAGNLLAIKASSRLELHCGIVSLGETQHSLVLVPSSQVPGSQVRKEQADLVACLWNLLDYAPRAFCMMV